jgi:hypothetical protein
MPPLLPVASAAGRYRRPPSLPVAVAGHRCCQLPPPLVAAVATHVLTDKDFSTRLALLIEASDLQIDYPLGYLYPPGNTHFQVWII